MCALYIIIFVLHSARQPDMAEYIFSAESNFNLDDIKYVFEYHPDIVHDYIKKGFKPFQDVAKGGRLDVMKWLHEQDPTLINEIYFFGWTPMHEASYHGHLDVVKWLHKQDPSLISVCDNYGWTPLHLASEGGHFDVVKWLHKQDPSLISVCDNYGWTPLHEASSGGHLDVVKWLHEQDPTLISVLDNNGWTPMHLSSKKGHLDVVKWLHEQNPTLINAHDTSGYTPLCRASVTQDNLHVMEWLISKQPSLLRLKSKRYLLERIGVIRNFPLHFAARDGDLEMMKSILKEEPDRIYEKDIWEMTPLHHAVDCNRLETVCLLCENNIGVINDVDAAGRDVFDIAYEKVTSEIVIECIQQYLIWLLCDLLTE